MNVDAAVACVYESGVATLGDLVDAAGVDVEYEPPWQCGHPVFRLAAKLQERGVVMRGQSRGMRWREIEFCVASAIVEQVAA